MGGLGYYNGPMPSTHFCFTMLTLYLDTLIIHLYITKDKIHLFLVF